MRKRYLRTIGTVVACLLAGMLLGAMPAGAGGPTSVLLVVPGEGRTAALYNDEPAYTQLAELLGTSPAATEPGAPSWPSDPGTSQINVTWLIHDVSVWRVDRIVLDYNGATWIETNGSISAGVDLDQPGNWHKAKDPATLRALLTKLGLIDAAGAKQKPDKPAPAVAVEPPVTPAAARTPATTTSDGLAWWWLLPTALLGLALGAAAQPVVSRLRTRTPRQELIDVTPGG